MMAENSLSDDNSFIDREIEVDCKQVTTVNANTSTNNRLKIFVFFI